MSHGKIVVTRLRASQILRSLVQMRPLTTYPLKSWCICSFNMLLQRSKAGPAQSRGTSAWRACAKRRYVLAMSSSHDATPSQKAHIYSTGSKGSPSSCQT